MALRNIPFLILSLPILYSRVAFNKDFIRRLRPFGGIVVLTITISIAGILRMNSLPNGLYSRTDGKECVDYIIDTEHKPSDLKVYTGFNTGSYAIYKGIPVYLDARAEVYTKEINKKKDILDEWSDLEGGRIDPGEFLDRYHFDYLIVQSNDILDTYLNSNSNKGKYEKIFVEEDGNCSVYVEKDTYADNTRG